MGKCLLLLLLALFAAKAAGAQTGETYVVRDSAIAHFTVDSRGNVYTWRGAALQKHDAEGRLLCQIDNPSLGNISYVHADGTGTLVFYAESGTFVFTDDRLAPIGSAPNLYDHSLNDITLAAYLPNAPGRIVLYDRANQDLVITDRNLHTAGRIHCTFADFAPTRLQTVASRRIYLFNPGDGFYLFDQFGAFDRKIPVGRADFACIVPEAGAGASDNILYLADGAIHCYSISRMEDKTLTEAPGVREFAVGRRTCWRLDGKGVCKTEF